MGIHSFLRNANVTIDMRHIQYLAQTLPPSPLVLAFHLVLGKFLTYIRVENLSSFKYGPNSQRLGT